MRPAVWAKREKRRIIVGGVGMWKSRFWRFPRAVGDGGKLDLELNPRNCETRVFHRRPPPGISTPLFAHAMWPCSVALSPTHRFCYRAEIPKTRAIPESTYGAPGGVETPFRCGLPCGPPQRRPAAH